MRYCRFDVLALQVEVGVIVNGPYKIAFRGEVADGHAADDVRQKMARMFRKDDAALERLFSGKVVMLARDLEAEKASVAIGKLKSCGAVVYLLDADGRQLNTWCTVLLMLVIFLCFRSWRWLVLPLVVVQMTLALTRAVLVTLDLQLTMVSSMLAAIVTVVGVATVVHVIVRFRDARDGGATPREALLRAGSVTVVVVICGPALSSPPLREGLAGRSRGGQPRARHRQTGRR